MIFETYLEAYVYFPALLLLEVDQAVRLVCVEPQGQRLFVCRQGQVRAQTLQIEGQIRIGFTIMTYRFIEIFLLTDSFRQRCWLISLF